MNVARFTVLTVDETTLEKLEVVDRWITKPVSFVALSVQVKTAEVLAKVPATRLVGAAGSVKLGVAVFELDDEPRTFTAVT